MPHAPHRHPFLLPALLAVLALAGCDAMRGARAPEVPAAPAATAGGTAGAPTAPAAACPADATRIDAAPARWAGFDDRVVCITAPLTITGNHRFADGEVLVAFDGRLATPTERVRPGEASAALFRENLRRTLSVEGLPAGAHDSAGRWRAGGVLANLSGRISVDGRGDATLRVSSVPAVTPAPRPAAPTVGGDVRVAALNVHNLFNGDGTGGGFPTPRGAETRAGFERQQARIVATIRALDPDVIALLELENDGDGARSAAGQLVTALRAGGGDWRAVRPPGGRGPGSDQIRVGLLYRSDRVREAGTAAVLHGGPFDALSRVPLAQAFRAGDGPAFTVAAVHLKSKGCKDAEGADANQRDGQSCWNATRVDSARRLDAWMATDPARSGSDLAVMVGDFNAYAQEDPIHLLRGEGWQDAFDGADPATSYSFVYDGQAGRLDHALLSPALAPRLAGAAKWHANADEVPVDEDAAAKRGDAGGDSAWGASDHDPLLLGLRLRGGGE